LVRDGDTDMTVHHKLVVAQRCNRRFGKAEQEGGGGGAIGCVAWYLYACAQQGVQGAAV
jgi:hypothetical protein